MVLVKNKFLPLRHKGDILFLLLALLATLGSARNLAEISEVDPWFHNLDMDMHNMVDALLINSGFSAGTFDQPGVPMKNLLALDYRMTHRFGHLTAWNLGEFDALENPLAAVPRLMSIGRSHSRVLVAAFLLAVGLTIYGLCRSVRAAALGVILMAGSSGLLFQGLLTRPELLCAFFGQILAFFCMSRGIQLGRSAVAGIWFAAAGLCVGFSILDKLPGLIYLVIYGGWAALDTMSHSRLAGEAETQPTGRWPGWLTDTFLIVLPSGATYCWTNLLWHGSTGLEAIEVSRLHFVSVTLVAGALLIYLPLPCQWRNGWQTSLRRCLLLASGAVAALPLSYLFLRITLSERSASNYICYVIHTVIQPSGVISAYAANQHMFAEFGKFIGHDLWLIGLALLGTILTCVFIPGQRPIKTASAVLLVTAFGMAMLMAKRYFILSYVIFTQVPLLLVITLCVYATMEAIDRWITSKFSMAGWAGAMLVACALIFTGDLRLKREYSAYQGFSETSNQIEFIYRNGTLSGAYRLLMQKHYGNEAGFEKSLNTMMAKTRGDATLGTGAMGTVDR